MRSLSASLPILLAPSIVARLRMVFAAIVMVILMATSTSFNQLANLNNSVQQLTLTSVPVFIKSEETERSLKSLLLLLQRVDGITDITNLEPLDQQLRAHLIILREKTTILADHAISENVAKHMRLALFQIEIDTLKILAAKKRALRHEGIVNQLDAELKATHDAIRLLLEDLSFEASVAREFDTYAPEQEHADVPRDVDQRVRQNLALATKITTIALKIEAVVDSAKRLQSAKDLGTLGRLQKSVSFKLKGITVLIGSLPDTETRTLLAVEVTRIRDLILGQNGMSTAMAGFRKMTNDVHQFIAEQQTPIELISDLSDGLINATRTLVDTAEQNVRATTRHMTVVLALATILSICVIAAAIILIVEKQISRRMANLTNAVLEIADGNTDQNVDVTGPDELGKMARALEVFRLNAQELRRSNDELEQFAFAASHDLRSPLRAIQDLAEWTMEDPDTVLSDDGRENMALLFQRIERLNQLLADLLEYSRAGRENADLNDVSVAGIVQDMSDLLDPEKRFAVRYIGPAENVVTYATPLRQILLNLISNSMKHHDRLTGCIDISVKHSDQRVVISVQDDGPGIPPQFQERIFGLFQTLRPRDDVEGSGLGLAIIQKLVDRYGGTISVHSNPNSARGTIFKFDLPERGKDSAVVTETAKAA